MGFELYERQRATGEEETVKVTKAGMLSLSPAVSERYFKDVGYVQLYFDASTNRVGIKPAKKTDKYIYELGSPANSKRRTVSGRGFLRKYKIVNQMKDGDFESATFDAKFDHEMLIFLVKKS